MTKNLPIELQNDPLLIDKDLKLQKQHSIIKSLQRDKRELNQRLQSDFGEKTLKITTLKNKIQEVQKITRQLEAKKEDVQNYLAEVASKDFAGNQLKVKSLLLAKLSLDLDLKTKSDTHIADSESA